MQQAAEVWDPLISLLIESNRKLHGFKKVKTSALKASSPEQLGALIAGEMQKWRKVITDAKISLE